MINLPGLLLQLTSYGGRLQFTVSSNGIPDRGDTIAAGMRRPDVMITVSLPPLVPLNLIWFEA